MTREEYITTFACYPDKGIYEFPLQNLEVFKSHLVQVPTEYNSQVIVLVTDEFKEYARENAKMSNDGICRINQEHLRTTLQHLVTRSYCNLWSKVCHDKLRNNHKTISND